MLAYLDRVRRRRPGATPADVIDQLERRYLATVVGAGAAAGGAAALPGVGTGASVASGVAEVAAFISATATFVLALAEVHDVPADDPQVRRALVLTVLLGDVGAAALAGTEVEAKHWAQVLGRTQAKDAVRGINARLGQLLVTRFGARQGALLVGRALPFGVGAGVGAVGNLALGPVGGEYRAAGVRHPAGPLRRPTHRRRTAALSTIRAHSADRVDRLSDVSETPLFVVVLTGDDSSFSAIPRAVGPFDDFDVAQAFSQTLTERYRAEGDAAPDGDRRTRRIRPAGRRRRRTVGRAPMPDRVVRGDPPSPPDADRDDDDEPKASTEPPAAPAGSLFEEVAAPEVDSDAFGRLGPPVSRRSAFLRGLLRHRSAC